MGVEGPTLPILAIILAVSGLVLGAFTFTSVSRLEAQINLISDQNSWYKDNATTFNTDPIYTHLTFTSLTIEFILGQNQPVYFSFTARAHIEPIPTSWSRIFVYFRVDGLLQSEPRAEVGMYNGAFIIHDMIHLQTVISDLSSGIHNVTVDIYGDSTANYIWSSTLFVQKVEL